MNHKMNYPVRYFECFDSVRTRWTSEDIIDGDKAYAQAFREALVCLAFGNDIVIQQSFALDSYAFQQVLSDLKEAHASVKQHANKDFWKNEKLPIRLHLHGAGVRTFREAAAASFRRMGDGSFHSSLYPDLNDPADAQEIADEIYTSGSYSRLMEFLGDDLRRKLFQDLWEWFGAARTGNEREVVSPQPLPHTGLNDLIAPMLHDSSLLCRGLADQGLLADRSIASVIKALRVLDAASGVKSSFASRSGLYGNGPWSAGGGPSAGELVGDALPLVQEVVSTLYNRVTVDSIGVASASYSTEISDAGLADGRLRVQDLALRSAVSARGENPWPELSEGKSKQPAFELTIVDRDGKSQQPFDTLYGPTSGRTVDAFQAVLLLREDPTWRDGLAKLSAASASGDRVRYGEELRAHLHVISEKLGKHCSFRPDPTGFGFTVQDPTLPFDVVDPVLAWFDAESLKPFVAAGRALLGPKIGSYLTSKRSTKATERALALVVAAPRET
jgi:hypothetical protein